MKYFILIIICFFAYSCRLEMIKKSSIKLDGKNTGISNLIKINGFYYNTDYLDDTKIMFFEDGTVIKFLAHNMRGKENIKIINFFDFVNSWIRGKQIRWSYADGVYLIKNDTVITHIYSQPCSMGQLLDEERYRIIDRETIKKIYVKGLLKTDQEWYKTRSPWIQESVLRFKSVDSIPPSDCWLKEKKWIWQNESDWKKYMEYIKQKKKEFKKK